MTPLTRRRALLASASGLAALAGCSGGDDDPPTVDRPSADRPIEDYEVQHVRNEDGAVLFARGEEVPTVTDDDRGRHARSGRSVVVTEDDLADLSFGDAPEADQLASFAEATDFDASSLYLFAMPVEACYEIHLRSVTVEWDGRDAADLHPHADFCRSFLPADVECRSDETHTVGFAIRLPVAAEQSSGSGSGMSNSCRPSPRGEYFEAQVTPAGGGEDE